MNVEDKVDKTAVREQFEQWLHKTFGLRLFFKHCQVWILESEDAGTATKHLIYHPPRLTQCKKQAMSKLFPIWGESYDMLPDEGPQLMKEVAAKHDLLLDLDGDSVFITCNKAWCRGRRFELRLQEVAANTPREFVVHGLNTWKPFPEEPESFENSRIQDYILHRMLRL